LLHWHFARLLCGSLILK